MARHLCLKVSQTADTKTLLPDLVIAVAEHQFVFICGFSEWNGSAYLSIYLLNELQKKRNRTFHRKNKVL
jgi:hypothetical protein